MGASAGPTGRMVKILIKTFRLLTRSDLCMLRSPLVRTRSADVADVSADSRREL
jgi:hypothetical protein